MRLSSKDLRELNLFKYYRLVRKWACKTYDILDADLELLIYLDCKKHFRILLAEEDLPTSERSKFYKNKTYTDKVYNKAIDDMIKDKER